MNLALRKPAYQSTTYVAVHNGIPATADRAVDGITVNLFYHHCMSCTHTQNEKKPLVDGRSGKGV